MLATATSAIRSSAVTLGMLSSAPQGPPADVILVIDDEPQIRRLVRNALTELDFRVVEGSTYRAGLDLAASERPALIVLDLGLPDGDGLDLCRDLRAFTHVPIIVLSARHSDREKEALLDAGADDYVTKPFSTLELRARIKAQLRRAAASGGAGNQDPVVQVHGVTVDLVARTVKRDGEEIHLTPTEWSLLRVFIAHSGQTLTHSQLFSAVWHDGAGDAQQYLRVYVGQLRRKLEIDPVRPRLIRTEPGVGYRFESDA
jgi:two-component system, OmpR family, KDP operon response regulator KdpE